MISDDDSVLHDKGSNKVGILTTILNIHTR